MAKKTLNELFDFGNVFIEPSGDKQNAFTNSEIVARCAEISHHAVQQMIVKHQGDLEEFGILALKMREIAGRGQPEKIYQLNEQQAMLLITYLKNTPPVRAFKKGLVRDFFRAKEYITRQRIQREAGKQIQRTLTDAVRDSGEGERMHSLDRAISNYCNLACIAATGVNKAKLAAERGFHKKAPAANFLTPEELTVYDRVRDQIRVLLDLGMQYGEIKSRILKEEK